MVSGVPGLEHVVPFLHLCLVQANFPEHGDPIVYIHLFIHTVRCFTSVVHCVTAMTMRTLNCEAIDGSTILWHFFWRLSLRGDPGWAMLRSDISKG